MRGNEKVLVTNLAVHEIGKDKLEYAVEHCLVYRLIEKGFKFPYHNFIPATLPDYGTGLLSRELEHDIDNLVSRGSLELKSASPFIAITRSGIQEAKSLVSKLSEEGEQYEELKSIVKDAIESDLHVLLHKCYTSYIRKEYNLAES